jgi:hypothetical protein
MQSLLAKNTKRLPCLTTPAESFKNSGTTATCFGMMGSTSCSGGFLYVRTGFYLLSLINGSWHIVPNFIHSRPSSP